MATAVPARLGLACLLLLLAGAADGDCTAATTTELPHDETTLTVAETPASSHHLRASSTSTSTTPATTAAAAPAPPGAASSSCPCVCVVVRTREAAVEDLVPAPGGVTAAATTKALLHALPLLAVPFLPTPLAALVALSALASPVRAGRLSNETCPGRDREHATCTVYRYLPDGCIDCAQPFAGLRKVCHAGSDERVLSKACSCDRGDPFHSYCRVRTLELYDGPERINFRVLPGHQQPIADPDAVVARGGDVCYVELEHGNHREGYYILCPVRKCPRLPFLCCPEFQHDAVVAAA